MPLESVRRFLVDRSSAQKRGVFPAATFGRRLSRFRRKRMFEGLFQPTHLIIILVIAVFVFGPQKLPELGKSLGEGIRGFKKAMSDINEPDEKK
jgi:sec-independent protein translocase protein TatA